MMRPFTEAIDVQKDLVAAYGEREAYIPPPQGITSDRIEAFFVVRQAVMPMCEKFRKISESFAAMDELDKGGEEPSKGEVFKALTTPGKGISPTGISTGIQRAACRLPNGRSCGR